MTANTALAHAIKAKYPNTRARIAEAIKRNEARRNEARRNEALRLERTA